MPIMPNTVQENSTHDHNSPTLDQSNGLTLSHDNPSRISELDQQLTALLESKQQLQNELNTVLDQQHRSQHEILQIRQNQDNAIEIAKKDISSKYESQISSLQYSLLQSESAQQDVEKRLFDLNSSHSLEVEDILKQQEEIRLAFLQEKDLKHGEHVARLTERFSSQMEATDVMKDGDEQEAERLRMIKNKMLEMFQEEKKQLLAANENEKVLIRQNSQKLIENYRIQTEQLANSKIQELHAQFMSAHQVLLEEKHHSDGRALELSSRLGHIETESAKILNEKSDLQQRYDRLSEAHLAEIEKARHTSSSLESKINDWRGKASKLESRIHKSETDSQGDLDNLREENDKKIGKLNENYEERLRSLQELADDLSGKLTQTETERDSIAERFKQGQREEIEQIEQNHTLEVDVLNRSIRDLNADKGSLEMAEEHMKSVHKQLENYRKQEISFQNKLDEREKEYSHGIDSFKQKFEKDKHYEVQQVTAKFDSQIKSLEEEISSMTASVESGDTERRHLGKIESIRAKHKQTVSGLESKQEKLLRTLREKLEQEHAEQLETLTTNHTRGLAQLREEMASALELQKNQLAHEKEIEKQNEIERLVEEHKSSLENITKSIAGDITTKSEEHTAGLEQALKKSNEESVQLDAQRRDVLSQLELAQRQNQELSQNLQRTQIEMERLSKDCDRYQKQTKSLEVDHSISQSVSEQDEKKLNALKQQISEMQLQKEGLETRLEEVTQSQSINADNAEIVTKLTDDLATRNVAIADLHSQNDSLSTEVFSLTQKCQEVIKKSHSLQEQLETSWGANEEIDSLKLQVSVLLPLKNHITALKEDIKTLKALVRCKDEAAMTLDSQLEQATQYVTVANTRRSETEKTLTETLSDAEQLRERIALKDGQEKELQKMLGDFETQVDNLSWKLNEVETNNSQQENTSRELEGRLASALERVSELETVNGGLENDCQISQLAMASQDDRKSSEEQLQSELERVCSEKEVLVANLASVSEQQKQKMIEQNAAWEYKISQLENELGEVKSELAEKQFELSSLQSEFSQKLKDTRENSPRVKPAGSKERLGNVSKEKSVLEDTLSRARIALTEKLSEKGSLERELSLHRVELERRLSEKQHLEELLAEKSRFEQELHSQKELLQNELQVIESKMKLKEVVHSDENNSLPGERGLNDSKENIGIKTQHRQKSKHKRKK